MFNHYPTRVFGLGRKGHNFAELVQIKVEDLVISLPFQVGAT
jgi:hypothetical protein